MRNWLSLTEDCDETDGVLGDILRYGTAAEADASRPTSSRTAAGKTDEVLDPADIHAKVKTGGYLIVNGAKRKVTNKLSSGPGDKAHTYELGRDSVEWDGRQWILRSRGQRPAPAKVEIVEARYDARGFAKSETIDLDQVDALFESLADLLDEVRRSPRTGLRMSSRSKTRKRGGAKTASLHNIKRGAKKFQHKSASAQKRIRVSNARARADAAQTAKAKAAARESLRNARQANRNKKR